ncbi:hypothetical protein BMR1_03g04120 [Babesia microti strain RI]|uniref:Uncharacterized protein n=1 Tax=Babesia microti (strain RI) TaxID=1133968 RepID=A0A1R4AC95_BABMR|nr:hypothetical protein BMR1_03g04120 [Babesia microti strain RI]SJK86641.1 hypothetical protein BMR1_03g04120 [Babesia microti strain RI]|eukprot:XP_021338774.1 hypothetical protein BMR1_03g04120 [Babesia microti strain RI]
MAWIVGSSDICYLIVWSFCGCDEFIVGQIMAHTDKNDFIQKSLCHEECLKCDVAKRIWLEGKASLHWNLENNKRSFLSHAIDSDIKCDSLTNSGDKFYDVETIDIVKDLPTKQPKFDAYEYNSGLEKIIFYNSDDKDRNYRYFGNKINLTRHVFKTRVKKRKLDSSLLAASPAAPWSKCAVGSTVDTLDGSCKDKSTLTGLMRCGERVNRDEKAAVQETSLKYVLEQALKSIESRGDESKPPSKFISKEGVNFKGYHPSADHNELFEQAFGKLPMFDNKYTSQTSSSTPLVNAGIAGIMPIMGVSATPPESNFPMPATPGVGVTSMPNTPVGITAGQNQGTQFTPFGAGQPHPTAEVNPFAAQFPSGRRRGRSRR